MRSRARSIMPSYKWETRLSEHDAAAATAPSPRLSLRGDRAAIAPPISARLSRPIIQFNERQISRCTDNYSRIHDNRPTPRSRTLRLLNSANVREFNFPREIARVFSRFSREEFLNVAVSTNFDEVNNTIKSRRSTMGAFESANETGLSDGDPSYGFRTIPAITGFDSSRIVLRYLPALP